jgi:hypothetical protein
MTLSIKPGGTGKKLTFRSTDDDPFEINQFRCCRQFSIERHVSYEIHISTIVPEPPDSRDSAAECWPLTPHRRRRTRHCLQSRAESIVVDSKRYLRDPRTPIGTCYRNAVKAFLHGIARLSDFFAGLGPDRVQAKILRRA